MKKIEVFPDKPLNGWILLDKKRGLSSTEALNKFKASLRSVLKNSKLPKIGYGGTLDPLASGILPIALGEATKTVDYVINKPKTYIFTILFGISTKSYDLDSDIVACNNFFPSKLSIEKVLKSFLGNIEQVPPVYSALKVSGKRAYKYARAGQYIKLKSRVVNVYTIKLLSYKKNLKSASFVAKVSKGTYIRSLAYDIAKKLNALGVVSYLRRISIGNFKEKSLHSTYLFYNNYISLIDSLLNIEQTLDDIPVINFNKNTAKEILDGKTKFLNSDFFKGFDNNIYQCRYKNQVFSLLNIINGRATILRNFNYLNMECTDVDKQ